MTDRRLLWACVTASAAAMLLSALLHSQWSNPTIYSDIQSFWGRDWVASGQLPYSSPDTFLEYPPVSGLALYASRIFGGIISGVAGGEYAGYYVAFSLLCIAASILIAWSAWRLAGDLGVRANPLYFFLPSMIIYGVYNFDIFNALFIVLALQLFVEKRRGWSAVMLGVAVATKLVAALLLPILIIELAGSKDRIRYVVLSAASTAAFFVPIAVFNPGFFSQFLSYFSGWGLEDAWYIWIFGSPFSSFAKPFGADLLVVLLVRVYTLRMPLVQKCLLALSSYLLATYIYAPQFNLMLIPLVAVLAITSPSLYLMEAFNALIILTWFTVPATPTGGPTYPWTLPQAMALLRSVFLALLGVSVAAEAGHSLPRWLASRLGLSPSVQQTLPVSETAGS